MGGDQLSGPSSPYWGPDSHTDRCVHENDEARFDWVEGKVSSSLPFIHICSYDGMVQEGPAVADIIRVLGRERTLSRLQ